MSVAAVVRLKKRADWADLPGPGHQILRIEYERASEDIAQAVIEEQSLVFGWRF